MVLVGTLVTPAAARTAKLARSEVRIDVAKADDPYFRMIADADPPALDPDVRIAATLDDALAGRDPVLEAALHYPSG